MYRYLDLISATLRHSLMPHLLIASGLLLLLPAVFGIAALDAQAAAVPLELGLSFLGVILFSPILQPEQEAGVWAAVASRSTPYPAVCLLRALLSLLLTAALSGGFVLLMRGNACAVGIGHWFGAVSNAVFLGGLGLLSAATGGNIAVGYMVPVCYYALNLMGDFGRFSLFSMMQGGGDNKLLLFGLGTAALAAAVGLRQYLQRR